MSDVVRELSGDEARMAVLAFMGQNMGSLKELDKQIISKNNTLQGITLNPERVISSIPRNAVLPAPELTPVNVTPVSINPTVPNLQVQISGGVSSITPPSPQVAGAKTSPDQLELNFTYDIARDIVDRLERVEKLLCRINAILTADKQPASKSDADSLKKS